MELQGLPSGKWTAFCGGETMELQGLPSGKWTAFCFRCQRGAIMRPDRLLAWVIQHQQRHQQGAAQ